MKRKKKYLVPAHLKTRRSSHRLTPRQIDRLVAHYLEGKNAAATGRRFRVSLDNVRYHVKKRGQWPGGRIDKPIADRLWDRVDMTAGPRGCWIWQGATFPNGYGSIGVHGESRGVHRVAYELTRGPIPLTLTIDHTCENKLCVNPAHLEPVTGPENSRRYHRRKAARVIQSPISTH